MNSYDPWYELVPGPAEPEFDAARTALISVDLQYFDAHPEGWMGRVAQEKGKPELLQERWEAISEILPRVRRLQDACREAGVELIHLRIAYRTQDCRDGVRSQPTPLISVRADKRDYEFLEEVAPEGDEIVINKTTSSAFNSTTIDQILHAMDIDRLWFLGIVTHGCVELTARDAADRGYFVTLVSDACASSTEALHEQALARMSTVRLIKIHTVDDLIASMRRTIV